MPADTHTHTVLSYLDRMIEGNTDYYYRVEL